MRMCNTPHGPMYRIVFKAVAARKQSLGGTAGKRVESVAFCNSAMPFGRLAFHLLPR